MNRRSFIWKALAGLAAVPVIGKLVQAKPVEFPAPNPDWHKAQWAAIHDTKLGEPYIFPCRFRVENTAGTPSDISRFFKSPPA